MNLDLERIVNSLSTKGRQVCHVASELYMSKVDPVVQVVSRKGRQVWNAISEFYNKTGLTHVLEALWEEGDKSDSLIRKHITYGAVTTSALAVPAVFLVSGMGIGSYAAHALPIAYGYDSPNVFIGFFSGFVGGLASGILAGYLAIPLGSALGAMTGTAHAGVNKALESYQTNGLLGKVGRPIYKLGIRVINRVVTAIGGKHSTPSA